MTSITSLPAPEYSEDERHALIDFLLALKKTHIQEFFRRINLPRSGTKTDLRERLEEALEDGHLTYEQAVEFLDTVAPWGKQHVFLYAGPRGDLRAWKDPELLLRHLKSHRVGKYFNARLPLISLDKLTLSSITHEDGRLRISAVQKRCPSRECHLRQTSAIAPIITEPSILGVRWRGGNHVAGSEWGSGRT